MLRSTYFCADHREPTWKRKVGVGAGWRGTWAGPGSATPGTSGAPEGRGRETAAYKPVQGEKDEGPRCGQLGGNGGTYRRSLGERRPKEEVPAMTLNVYRVEHSITTTQSTDPVKGLPHAQAGLPPSFLLKVKPAFLSLLRNKHPGPCRALTLTPLCSCLSGQQSPQHPVRRVLNPSSPPRTLLPGSPGASMSCVWLGASVLPTAGLSCQQGWGLCSRSPSKHMPWLPPSMSPSLCPPLAPRFHLCPQLCLRWL